MNSVQYAAALRRSTVPVDPVETWNTRYREALERNGLQLVYDTTRALPTWCVPAPHAVDGWDSWDARTRIAPRPTLDDGDRLLLGAITGIVLVTLILWVLGGLKW